MSPARDAVRYNEAQNGRLSRVRLIQAALEIVDKDGARALNMRRLGEVMGVSAPALYHHFNNKDDLLLAIVEHVRSNIEIPDPHGLPLIEWLMAIGREYFAAFFAHPNLVPVVLGESNRYRTWASLVVEYILGQLSERGIPPEDRLTFLVAIDSFALGSVLVAVRNDAQRAAAEPLSQLATAQRANTRTPPELFEHGLRALAESLLARYDT
jgi:AcrR family transcriptional regulator